MSLFSSIFGSSKPKQKEPSTLEAIGKLKETVELLERKSIFIEGKVEAEISAARKNASSNKRIAIQALKRKKRLEKQLKQIDGSLSTLEFQIESLGSAHINVEVLGSMKFASDALKKAQMNPDDVHDIMDDLAEQKDLQDEISEAISTVGQSNTDVDEDELMAELEDLENENFDEVLNEIEDLDKLPDAPSTELPKVKSKKTEEEEGLKELVAWVS